MKFKWLIPVLLLVIVLAGYSAKENGQFKGFGSLSEQFVRDVSHISDLSMKLGQYNQRGYVEAAGKEAKIDITYLKMSNKTTKEIMDYYNHMPSYKKETKYKKWRPELQLEMQQLTEAQGELSVFLNNTKEPTVLAELPSVIHQLNSICAEIEKTDKAIEKDTNF